MYRLVIALEPESVKNAITKDAYSQSNYDRSKYSLLEALELTIKAGEKLLEEEKKVNDSTPTSLPNIAEIFKLSDAEISAKTGWEAESITLERAIKAIGEKVDAADEKEAARKKRKEEKKKAEEKAQRERALAYFRAVYDELKAVGAKTWDEIFPLNTRPKTEDPQNPKYVKPEEKKDPIEDIKKLRRYWQFTSYSYNNTEAGAHLYPLYDELYESVWKGDNDRIRALCLPSDDKSAEPKGDLLQITVMCRLKDFDNRYGGGTCLSEPWRTLLTCSLQVILLYTLH